MPVAAPLDVAHETLVPFVVQNDAFVDTAADSVVRPNILHAFSGVPTGDDTVKQHALAYGARVICYDTCIDGESYNLADDIGPVLWRICRG